MKILVVPDSFKGSMTSKQVCDTIKKAITENRSDLGVKAIPFADGGEGFTDAFKQATNGETISAECHNIYGQKITANYIGFGDTAVIESAAASGILPIKRVMQASSYGTGELIKDARTKGFRNIILGLGGTGCCDGGAGCLAALGGVFYDECWNAIPFPKGNDLNFIYGVNLKNVVKDIHFTFACDVNNEYFGKNGAAYIFAPQKGASKTDVEALDEGLKRLNAFFKNDIGRVKGAGAAGGICGALYSLYGGEIKSGFDILADFTNLEEEIKSSDIVITGEGKTDAQTLMGKLPFKISELCKRHGKRCVLISGEIDNVRLADVQISLVDRDTSVEEAMESPVEILYEKVVNALEIML